MIFDGEDELAARVDPALGIEREASAGDDAVQVWVEAKIASPGVQHRGDAEQRLEASGVSSEFVRVQRAYPDDGKRGGAG